MRNLPPTIMEINMEHNKFMGELVFERTPVTLRYVQLGGNKFENVDKAKLPNAVRM